MSDNLVVKGYLPFRFNAETGAFELEMEALLAHFVFLDADGEQRLDEYLENLSSALSDKVGLSDLEDLKAGLSGLPNLDGTLQPGLNAEQVGGLTASAITALIDAAKAVADSAQSAANTAKTTADAAQTTANTANTTAKAALPKAGGTLTGNLISNNPAVGTQAARNIYAGTSDLTAGSSSLTTGVIYFVYE